MTKETETTQEPEKKPLYTPGKIRVFAHKQILGIAADPAAPGVLNKPLEKGQLGFVCDATKVEFSQEALDLLGKVQPSHDDIGEVDAWMSGDKAIFGWLGGPLKLLPIDGHMKDGYRLGSNSYDVKALVGATIVPNDPPPEFIKAAEGK